MAVIRVPKTPKRAFNKNRPASKLLRSQIEHLEWAVRLALECRRRVKEQQKRIGSAEFRNTQFSYQMSQEGIEKFVATPCQDPTIH